MGIVELSKDGKELVALAESKEDKSALQVAFRATIGASPFSLRQDIDEYRFPSDNLGNICALWATGFEWRPKALEAVFDILIPLAQRKIFYPAMKSKPGEVNPL